jgi:RNA polymerase sigma factor (sigma-70 family)
MNSTQVSAFLRHVRHFAKSPDSQVKDRELLESFLERREEEAFAALLRRHGPMVLAVCRTITHNWHTAEDAFQATFLLLAQKASTIRQRDSVGSWLHGVARHVAQKAVTAAMRRRTGEEKAKPMMPRDPLLDMSLRELQKIIHEELEKLPEKYRTILVHCYLEGKTHEQAARQLGWSKGTVRGRLNRGREMLRSRLTRRGLTVSAGVLTTALTIGSTPLALSGPLAEGTVRAAVAMASGGSSVVSAEVASLVSAGAKALSALKLKTALIVLLTLALFGTGAGVLAHSLWQKEQGRPSTNDSPLSANQEDKKDPPTTETKRVDRQGDPLPAGALVRLGTTRLRHAEGVKCVALSPDGKTIACGSDHEQIHFWDKATGQEKGPLRHAGQPSTIAYSPDGRWFAAAGGKRVEVWDTVTGKKQHEFPCATFSEISNTTLTSVPLVYSQDSKKLASVDVDHAALVWDLTTGKELGRLTGHEAGIHCIRFLDDDKTLVTACGDRIRDGSIRFWDLKTAKATKTIELPAKPFYGSSSFALSPDGSLIAVEALAEVRKQVGAVTQEYMEYRIHLLDTASGKERLRLPGKNAVIVTAVFSPDGKRLAMATRDDQVTVWDVARGKALHQFQQGSGGSPGGTYALAFSSDGQTLVSSAEGTALHVWDISKGREVLGTPAHAGEVLAIAYAPDGRFVATASADHSIRLWETRAGKPMALLRGHERDVTSLAFSPDGRYLTSAAMDRSVRLWQIATGLQTHNITLEDIKLPNGVFQGVRRHVGFTPDGKTFFAVGSDLSFHMWEVTSGKEVNQRVWHLGGAVKPLGEAESGFVQAAMVQLSPDAKTAAVLFNKELHFLDVASGQEFAKMDNKGVLASMAFAADGRTLASGGWDKTVRLWEVASGKLIRSISVPGFINSTAFSPNGRFVAVGCGWLNATIRLYEVSSGKEVVVFQGIGSCIGTVQFSPDGRTLASGQRDTTALLWDVSTLQRSKTPKPTSLEAAELEKLWTDLRSEETSKAHASVWTLAASPLSATSFLKDRLPPVPIVTEKELLQLIAELDSSSFEEREAASKELLQLGSDAFPALRRALDENTPAEARRRIEALLESPPRLPLGAEQLRRLRAILALEQAGSEEAVSILKELAKGAPAAPETREATAALERLGKLVQSQP